MWRAGQLSVPAEPIHCYIKRAMNSSHDLSSPTMRAAKAIVVGGLIVGLLDLLYAILVYSPRRPIRVPQTIAAGLLGLNSYNGGMRTAVLGVVLHFIIALGAASVYYAASRRLRALVDHAIVCGAVYGALVYFFMHLVVLPLSALPHRHTPLIYQATEFVEHWFFVGLPIALSVRHYASSPKALTTGAP
jgi:uncharacterized membrane protein YagU involved in acid resistance